MVDEEDDVTEGLLVDDVCDGVTAIISVNEFTASSLCHLELLCKAAFI